MGSRDCSHYIRAQMNYVSSKMLINDLVTYADIRHNNNYKRCN